MAEERSPDPRAVVALSKNLKGSAAFWTKAKYGKMCIEGRNLFNTKTSHYSEARAIHESLGDHGIFLARNIRAARAAEIENTVYLSCFFGTSKIACDQTAKYSARDAKIIGALARTALHLSFQGDLRLCRHCGSIKPQRISLSS